MTKLKAVMFDMDGVLIDSERLSLSMWEKVNEARGHVFDVSVMTNMMGGSQQENFERFGPSASADGSVRSDVAGEETDDGCLD